MGNACRNQVEIVRHDIIVRNTLERVDPENAPNYDVGRTKRNILAGTTHQMIMAMEVPSQLHRLMNIRLMKVIEDLGT